MSHNDADAFYSLWQVYLHMRAWKLPDYGELDAESREAFENLVSRGELFAYVEDCKRAALRAKVPMQDRWLGVLMAKRVTSEGQLTQADRDELGEIIAEMYPTIVRLDAEAGEGKAANGIPRGLSVSKMLEISGLSDGTINRLAKKLGITTPGVGGQSHRYSLRDARRMFSEGLESTSSETRRKSQAGIQFLEQFENRPTENPQTDIKPNTRR